MALFRWLNGWFGRRSCQRVRPERDQLELILEEGKYLLHFAVEAGKEVEPDVAARIIEGTRRGPPVWDSPQAGELIAAISKLAAKLHPVTAETLRACRDDADGAIRGYKKIVYWLAVLIVPLSMISFIYTSITNTITAQLKIANDLAVALHLEVDTPATSPTQVPPPGSVTQLQQFAVAMRAAYGRAGQLNWLVADSVWNPLRGEHGREADPESKRSDPQFNTTRQGTTKTDKENDGASGQPGASTTAQPQSSKGSEEAPKRAWGRMELKSNLNANSLSEVRAEVDNLTKVYQEVRLYATNVQDQTSVIWGAISTCILPVLYALLGACAAVLRAFSKQIEARTFAPSYATPARFIIAAIGGGIVGLFNNFSIGQAMSLSPLAIAFLIGYAADIFFSFLEGSMQNLGKGKSP